MALVRATAESIHTAEYDVRIGISWTGAEPFALIAIDHSNFTYDGVPMSLRRSAPVDSSIAADADANSFHRQVHQLAEDCVSQGGISHLQIIATPRPTE